MNRLGPASAPERTTKSAPLLNTMPVGDDGGSAPGAVGTVTTSDCFTPWPSHSVETPVSLSATQTSYSD